MRGVVAAGDQRTADAARDVLADGGNAVDAAVAGAFTAFVCEPLLASAGGAGMMTVALADSPPLVVDFFSTMPGLGRPLDLAQLDFMAVQVDFGSTVQEFHVGRGSVAPPMALPGLLLAASRFGTRPLSRLTETAVAHARRGLRLSPENALVFELLWPIQQCSPETLALTSGRPPGTERTFQNPQLADLLEETGREGRVPASFNRALIHAFGPPRGGLLTEEDLLGATPRVCTPRRIPLGDWDVLTSPHVGGERIERLLRELERTPVEDEIGEALGAARACRAASEPGDVAGRGSTTHISVLDAGGGAASVTLTNGEGCGHVALGTGVQPNNFLGEQDLNPTGFHQHTPGRILPTMIAPTIALDRGHPIVALGSGGSNRIRSVVSQVLNRLRRGEALSDAVMAPRVHAEGGDVWLECCGWRDPDAVRLALGKEFERVHAFPERAFYFGGVHAVLRREDRQTIAVGDPRRGGATSEVT